MGVKRKQNPNASNGGKRLKKRKGEKTPPLAPGGFDVLAQSDSDSEVVYDFASKEASREPEIVFVESENDSDIVVESDSGEQEPVEVVDADSSEEPNNDVETKASDMIKAPSNELTNNQDFIEFGFSSSDNEEVDYDEYSDDGVLSSDDHNAMHKLAEPTSAYPWIKNRDHSRQAEVADWLTNEMKDFVDYISPSLEEIMMRNSVINTLKQKITTYWPESEVHVFGSSATDLYLPGSDIDLVAVSAAGNLEQRSKLYQLSSFLRVRKLAKDIEVIAKAKVPIIKFVDPKTNIHIDISFERMNGIEAAKKIRTWLETTPGLRELVLIIKQFLRSRKLNNVHVGGLGGYSTIIMCYHFLKLHPRLATNGMDALDNLGPLLIEFFELYGRNFSYDNLILAIDPETDMPKYLLKSSYPDLDTSRNPFSIVIQDPSDPHNNITRASYNLRDIKKAFGGAYQLLVEKCFDLNAASYKERLNRLILGEIIKYRGKTRDFNDDRHKIANDALVDHHKEEEDESDGANGNDKYYFSDITVESDDDDTTFMEAAQKVKPLVNNTRKIADIMGIESGSEEEVENNQKEEKPSENNSEEEERPRKKPKLSMLKEAKREYWRQKGLEL